MNLDVSPPLRNVREITGDFAAPSPYPLPGGARGHGTVISPAPFTDDGRVRPTPEFRRTSRRNPPFAAACGEIHLSPQLAAKSNFRRSLRRKPPFRRSLRRKPDFRRTLRLFEFRLAKGNPFSGPFASAVVALRPRDARSIDHSRRGEEKRVGSRSGASALLSCVRGKPAHSARIAFAGPPQ